MLDSETKRRIETARDILVGKVPDPKSQVEQITIALIYKFMDDMDAQSEEFGGKRTFFAGEFERYGWAKLMRSGLGGFEMLNLYAEAIAKMPENPGIPLLFRNIFKNAYLPYRDPETLRAFLKIIDDFSYDHSERLGDAFEYLLSVLGSQGDAGQFRTPRHIIDFMVAVLDPKKTETVLDPACGTAGFLISSYKHILEASKDAKGNTNLTPDERERLARNFRGYDISPDMVRLSLVNLYLHGFVDPNIAEYDTLTSQDKWNEFADVILANPPFMSPKGGIKPHKGFSVPSNRSEVLFVDYMAEHLTPTGRAGIIVPEGIVFQSQNAYKQLRKMLVEDFLVAVVSLPAGVFNPYSGVKTSILILDKTLAKKTPTIAFFKIEKDGYGLGAQRRALCSCNGDKSELCPEHSDIPHSHREIGEYLRRLRTGEAVEDFQPTMGLVVPKEKIAANGDYNLSGERYRENGLRDHAFPLVRLAEVCLINPRKSQLNGMSPDTRVSFVPMSDVNEFRISFAAREERHLSDVSNSYTYFEDNDVLLAKVTPCFENGKAGIARGLLNGIGFGSSEYYVFRPTESVLPEWIYFCLMHPLFRNYAIPQMTGTGGLQRVPRSCVEDFQIPLPPLEVQKEIVAEIEGYQKVIDGARSVVANYKPRITANKNWPTVKLAEVCSYEGGTQPPKSTFVYEPKEGYVRLLQIRDYKSDKDAAYIPITERHKSCVETDVMIGRYGPPVFQILRGKRGAYNVALIKCVVATDKITEDWLYHFLQSDPVQKQIISLSERVRQSGVRPDDLDNLLIPLPSIATQLAVVAEIEAEQVLVDSTKKLIERFERKIQDTLARVWGETNQTPAEAASADS